MPATAAAALGAQVHLVYERRAGRRISWRHVVGLRGRTDRNPGAARRLPLKAREAANHEYLAPLHSRPPLASSPHVVVAITSDRSAPQRHSRSAPVNRINTPAIHNIATSTSHSLPRSGHAHERSLQKSAAAARGSVRRHPVLFATGVVWPDDWVRTLPRIGRRTHRSFWAARCSSSEASLAS